MSNKKLQVWLPLMFAFVMIIGMFLGYKMNNNPSSGFFAGNRHNSLQEALDLIKTRYVDTVSFDNLQGKAIREMMEELDPHSVYLSPSELRSANEDLAGNFQGIGVEFNIFNDTVNAVYVIPDSPGDKAGMRVGDRLISVNDSSLTTKGITIDNIKDLIRGPKGSKAIFRILRGNEQQTITVSRGTIPVPSVDASYMIDKTTGYIRLNRFSETSYEEFMDAMEKLKKQNIQKLLLDLRDNGGGLMNEATDIADEFLSGDKLIVYTEGVNSKKREYRCKRPGIFETGDLIVLVNERSASASEVLSGALQDWCRAKIIGRRTFGKGLVQEQYPLSDGGGIRLTVARYYTPLGRSIQRSYEKGKKIYMDDFMDRYTDGQLLYADSNKVHNGKPFVTSCRDTVYGGGGIMPDIFIPIDTILYSKKFNDLFAGNTLNSYVYSYYLKNKQVLDQYNSPTDFAHRFTGDDLWQGFIQSPGIDAAAMTGSTKEFTLQRMKAILSRFKWRNEGYIEVLNTNDRVIDAALRASSN